MDEPILAVGTQPQKDPYLLESVAHACAVVKLLETRFDGFSLIEIVRTTGLNKTVAFRLLHTLERCGVIEKTGTRYRSSVRISSRARFTIGYAAQTPDSAFAAEVVQGLRMAADHEGLKLVALENQYSAKSALRNTETLIQQRVDLAIELQALQSAAPAVGARFRETGIPLLAIEVPHPGATYFGPDNYQAGVTAGRCLARWARQHWSGNVDQVLLLEVPAAGPLPQLRITGLVQGMQSVLPSLGEQHLVRLESGGEFAGAMQRVRRFLRTAGRGRVLIGGINDSTVLGALRAFEEAGRLPDCAAVGMGGIREARAEMRRPDGRLIGTVAFFPERYGTQLVRLALHILERRPVLPTVYVEHALLTPPNVNHFYPNDGAHSVLLNGSPFTAVTRVSSPSPGFGERNSLPAGR